MNIPPNLPEAYRRMAEACETDPPGNKILRDALDLYFITATCFNGAAWTDEHLGRTLAWSWMAGFPECCALHDGLNVVILVASYRFCIRGGCVPDTELIRAHLAPAARELYGRGRETPWLPALMDRYKILKWEKINYREWSEGVMHSLVFGEPHPSTQ